MPFDLSTAQPAQQTMPQNLTGDDFLKTIPPSAATLVKKYATGELAVTPQMTRTPQGVQLLTAITQYDPTFDATNYQKRQQTANAFAKGPQGNAVRGANQALYHMGRLYENIENLDNFGGIATPLNAPINYIQKTFGDPRQEQYKQTVQAVGSELRRVFAGAGGGSLAELKDWKEAFDPNASKEQQKAYLMNGVELLHGGLNALNQQYQQGMGLNKNVNDLLAPSSRKVYESLMIGENPNVKTKQTPAQKMGSALKANSPTGLPSSDDIAAEIARRQGR
jgi:hypothetical protein